MCDPKDLARLPNLKLRAKRASSAPPTSRISLASRVIASNTLRFKASYITVHDHEGPCGRGAGFREQAPRERSHRVGCLYLARQTCSIGLSLKSAACVVSTTTFRLRAGHISHFFSRPNHFDKVLYLTVALSSGRQAFFDVNALLASRASSSFARLTSPRSAISHLRAPKHVR